MNIRSHGGADHSMHIAFDTQEELESFRAALTSHQWVRWDNDEKRLISVPAHENPPLTKDIAIQETFFSWQEGPVVLQANYKDRSNNEHDDPAYYVQHIAGYSGDYVLKAKKMEAAGFNVIRSKRGKDGCVWEMWYLPGAWAAKGPLKGYKSKQVLDWLCNEIRPGQISIEGQMWGLSVD